MAFSDTVTKLLEKKSEKDLSESEFISQLTKIMISRGILNKRAVRDHNVKARYRELRGKGITGRESKEMISQEFYLSKSAIDYILYQVRK